ncbi:hypothetical protein SLEP1_g20639 [Rubroshorea leprosula]|uniref:RNase H type-1 domain-containing protein n=1 Tax=Rubroshorea leprosula TaxID=152421 RepID=A0AAV5JC52_9ROSI|nr:hypothetical protein SLEP1_g20639 [Rubroshorea leprosula]
MIPRTHSNQRKASQQVQEATFMAAGAQKTETQVHDDGVYKEIELAEYDGTQDLVEHVQGYRMAMMVYGALNALLCKQFPTTFRKAAQAWFTTLPKKSIQTFDQFANMFINHFTASRAPRKTNYHLLTIKQKTGESLRAYIARFHNETVQVERLDQSVAMHALMDGLKDSRPSRKEVPVVGIITIPIHVGDTAQKAVVTLDFFVVDIPCSFNAILGRPGLNGLQAVISTSHMMIKFPMPKGIGVARGRFVEIQETVTAQVFEQSEARKLRPKSRAWDLIATGDIWRRRALMVNTMDAREGINEQRAESIDRTKSVVLTSKNPDKTTNVGADMDPEFTAKLEECLRRNEGTFVGSAADMLGIDPKVACHRLGVPPEVVSVRQKMRQFGAEGTVAIKEEIEKLKEVGFIKEINFSEWLSNVVMVKKANEKWRMCIDFTDLNKVCPKDNYALPNIDELVDNSSGYEVLSFCDAYSGYNQIPLVEEDQDKTAFIAAGETYCYIVMPFGLKNAGATYQRFANKIFVLLKRNHEKLQKLRFWQILADFIVELSKEEKAALDTPLPTPLEKQQSSEIEEEQARVISLDLCWVLHVDGSSSENGSGTRIILTSPEGETFEYALKFTFEASNNRAEYEALLGGLRLAKAVNAEYIKVFSDSQLVVYQIKGNFNAQETVMTKYLEKAAQLLKPFKGYKMHHIKRIENSKADALAKLASSRVIESRKEIYVEELSSPSISEEEILKIEEEEEETWMNPIKRYLSNGDLPKDKKEAKKVKRKATWYTILGDHLYRRSYTQPWLRCLTPNGQKS